MTMTDLTRLERPREAARLAFAGDTTVFGASNIQELIGWVRPKEMPLRNNKADRAREMLGYPVSMRIEKASDRDSNWIVTVSVN